MWETIALGAGIAISSAILSHLTKKWSLKKEKKAGQLASKKYLDDMLKDGEVKNHPTIKTKK